MIVVRTAGLDISSQPFRLGRDDSDAFPFQAFDVEVDGVVPFDCNVGVVQITGFPDSGTSEQQRRNSHEVRFRDVAGHRYLSTLTVSDWLELVRQFLRLKELER